MGVKTASVTLEREARFLGEVGSGHTLVLDDAEGDAGARPAELLALSLAGCTAMDVISILRKKRQDVTAYRVEATGVQRDEHPTAYTRIDVLHLVEGPGVDPEAVRRSVELSAVKYCGVGATLSSGEVEIRHAYRLVTDGIEHTADVVVLGPNGAVRVLDPAAA